MEYQVPHPIRQNIQLKLLNKLRVAIIALLFECRFLSRVEGGESRAEGRMSRVEGRENDINLFDRVLFSNQFSQEKLTQFRHLTHRETFQQSFTHSFVINQHDDVELKMYFKHERSNLNCTNRWLGIRFIVEIMTLDIDEKNRFHHVRESEKAPLDDR